MVMLLLLLVVMAVVVLMLLMMLLLMVMHLLPLPTADLQCQILNQTERLPSLVTHQTHRRALDDVV